MSSVFSCVLARIQYLPSRDQVGKFFEPTVEAIVEAITEITAEANPAKTVRIRSFSEVAWLD